MLSKSRSYARVPDSDVMKHLKCYYNQSSCSFNKFCTVNSIASKRANLYKIFCASGAKIMKDEGKPWHCAMNAIKKHLNHRGEKSKNHLYKMSSSNRYLTNDEEKLVINMAKLMSTIGLGLEKQICLDIINAIIQSRIEMKDFKPATMSVLDLMIKKNKELVKLLSGNAIDAARVRQADADVRDSFFVRLDLYTKLLHKMNLIPWKSFSDVPKENKYNMDELATDTSGHRRKIVGCANHLGRLFQLTPEGDGRMPFHITICLTTNCSGKKYFMVITCYLFYDSGWRRPFWLSASNRQIFSFLHFCSL